MIGYYVPYLFIVKFAEDEHSIPNSNAVFLLSIIGFSNTAVRFVSGLITKIPHMTPLLVNNIGLIIAGLVTLLVPLCTSHGLLITFCVVWGAFIGEKNICSNDKFVDFFPSSFQLFTSR